MSLERVMKSLVSLGLSRSYAEVYVYLAKTGPQKVEDLAKALEINKQKILASLKNLQTKGLVTKERTIFSALPFEQTIELLIEIKTEQTQIMQERKEELLSSWQRIMKKKTENN
jgi:sugar-specific transcriptional regulator TrmB